MEEKKLNIYERASKVTSELKRVAKNLSVTLGKGGGYKAVGEVDVLDAVKPLEEEYGIYSYPSKRVVVESKEIVKANGNVDQLVRIETTYRAVNVDHPQEYIETVSYGDGVDSQDKAVGKAMTYADKYALMKLYKISTGDDPDQNASEDHVKPEKAPKATKKQIERIKELFTEDRIVGMLKFAKVDKLEDLLLEQASLFIKKEEEKHGDN